jgi:TPR repeat protein
MDFEELKRRAKAGSISAQTVLGINYLYGYDVDVDYDEAFRLLSAAGTSRAVLNLGIMHAKGLGVPQNLSEAIRLLEAVARPSDSSDAFAARIELGRLYSSDSDTDNALKWYEAAVALATEHEDSEDLREARAYIVRTKSR